MWPYLLPMLAVSCSLAYPTKDDIDDLRHQVADLKEQNIMLVKFIRNVTETSNQNFNSFKENTLLNLKKINEMERNNNENLANRVLWEFHHLRKETENILNTRLSTCAFKEKHRGFGKIEYDYLLSPKPARILGTEYKASNLLSPSCGEFKAPVAGTYQVSASAIVDTWEEGPQHAIFRFVYGTREEKHEALMYADLGPSKISDLVQVSRTVFIPLEKGDVLYLEQEKGRDTGMPTPVKKITFCVLLLSLDSHPGFQRSLFSPPSIQNPRLSPYQYIPVARQWMDDLERRMKSSSLTLSPPNTP